MEDLAGTISILRNKKINSFYDVELGNLLKLKKYSSVETHIVLYPYSRNITRNSYNLNPFEEYVKDLAKNKKSAYAPIIRSSKEIFGLFLGFIIALFFWIYKPSILLTVDSIVGILGAYFIGKDLWDDIEDVLVSVTKNWIVRYQSNYYSYKLDKNSTMTQYSHYAKKERYGKNAILPDKMEFIEEHNSSTARMYFDDLQSDEDTVHLLSIHVDPKRANDFESKGYLFGVKITLNRRFLFFNFGYDLFQSSTKGLKGCLDNNGKWLTNTAYYRNTISFGRIKIFLNKGYIQNVEILK